MNIDMVSIDYAVRLRLRDRLTLGRLTLPRNPWAYGEQVSHLFSHYSFWHNLFQDLHGNSHFRFVGNWNAPLPIVKRFRNFGGYLESRGFSAQIYSTSELLRTL